MKKDIRLNRPLLMRVLASPFEGLGHVTRCRGLADLAARSGQSVHWVLNRESEGLFQKLGLPGERTTVADAMAFDQEMATWQSLINRYGHDAVLIVDGYRFDCFYRQGLASLGLHWVLFDDWVLSGNLEADLVINYSPAATRADYEGRVKGQVLLGSEYTPLRLAFADAPHDKGRKGRYLLVMFGGADTLGLTVPFLDALEAFDWPSDIPVVLVSGAAYPYSEQVRCRLSDSHLPVRYEVNVSDMAPLMRGARLALSAAGSTLAELAVLGIPSVSLIVADNQERNARFLSERGWVPAIDARAGLDWKALLTYCVERWKSAIGCSAASWCDGQGIYRIAEAINRLGLSE